MKRYLSILLMLALVLTSLTACFLFPQDNPDVDTPPDDTPAKEVLVINVPSEAIQAELGSYDLPSYQVIDSENLIKAGYEVIVKKVLDPDGNEVTVAYNKINATKTGIYTITYGVTEGDVADAELKVDFADRTAPALDIKDDAIPKYYIQSMSYTLPVYTLSGDPDYTKCYVKVYYMTERGGEKTEVVVTDGRFTVEYNVGYYEVVIHAEDAIGNAKDYSFTVEATGPSEVVEGKILYSDEAFGASQLSLLWNVWSLEYSTEKAWEGEAGSIKVSAPGGATDYLILSKLIQRDVTAYDELVIRIYNANNYDVFTGCAWFGDTLLAANSWTEVVFKLDDLNAKGSHPAVAGLRPKSTNLENLALRFWTDGPSNTVEPGTVMYISAMFAREQEITGPSEVKEDVIAYFDEVWGSMQGSFFWTDCNKQEFVTDVKYGDEAGSLKITCLKDNQGWNYYTLNAPGIKNVTKYDFIEFYVYNSSEKDFMLQLLWGGDTTCKAGEWTRVKFPVALIANGVTDVNSKPIPATDITNLTICFYTQDMIKGDAFYFSQMKGGYEPEVLPDNLITNFDGATGLNPFNGTSSVEYVTDVKYGEEKGALKITANGAGEHYIGILSPRLVDVSGYDYIVFRVYTDKEITAGLLWCADTVCKAGEWTEVKVPVSLFADGKVHDFSAALSANNISGISLRLFSGLEAGESIYVSSMFAMKEEVKPDPKPDPEPEIKTDLVSKLDGSLNPFQGSSTTEYVTDVKYGEEEGSLKITANKGGEHYVSILAPEITDVSSYDYIVFRVYTDKEITAGTLWACDTVCKAGEWTEIKIPVSFIAEGKVTDFSTALPATDITGICVRIFTGLEAGEYVYVSHFYAVKEAEAPAPEHACESVCTECGKCLDTECTETACADKCQGHQTPDPELENIVISKLDENAGLNPFNGCANVEYVTDVKYGEEAGSLKITANAATEMYIAITSPEVKDVSGAKYVSFRVYNPNSYDITVGTMWFADTVCKAGEWTEVRVDASAFAEGKVDALSGADVTLADITGFSVRIVGTMTVGDAIYVSHLFAAKEPEPPHECESICPKCGKCLDAECAEEVCNDKCQGHLPVYEDVVSKLDGALNPFNGCAEVEYVTDTKYGEEDGSLKITAKAASEMYIAILNPILKNVSSYEYVVFRVYNPNSYDITVGTMWACDTVCKAGEWTEVRVSIDTFLAGNVDALSGADVLPTDLTGFAVRIVGTMVVGDVIYVSNVRAVKEDDVTLGATADLATLTTPEGKEGNYLNRTSNDGWRVENARSDEEAQFGHEFDMITINGKTTAIGSVTSPVYRGTLNKISFNYGYAYTEGGVVSMTVNVIVDGEIVATKQLYETGVEKYAHMTFEWTLEEPIEGSFMIQIVNDAPTQSTSNKDRYGLWNIKWE